MLKNIARFLTLKMNRRLYVISWLVFAILTFLLLSILFKVDRFYYDADNYWGLGAYFFRSGSFSFTTFDYPVRGYFFPLLLMPVHAVSKISGGHDVFLYNIFAAVCHPFFIVVVLPHLIKKLFHQEIKLYMIAVFYAMIMFFCYGFINAPLTDFWAIYFLCSAILIVKTQKTSFVGIACAGILLGLTCNLRPIYLCVLPLFIIYTILQSGGKNRRAAAFFILIFGVGLAWLPQVIINKANYDTYSPLMQTHVWFKDGLYFEQLNRGFAVEKYETDIDKPQDLVEVFYYNPTALSIIEKEQLDRKKPFKDKSSMFELFEKYPFDFFIIYSSHIFNAMDIKYPEGIITNYHRSRSLYSLINYTVIFVGLFLLFINYKIVFNLIFRSWKNFLLLSMFLLPVAFTIPTQMEVRFFLPLHILLYAACCFSEYPPRAFFQEKKNYLSILLLYVSFVGLCFYISSKTIADNPAGQPSRLGIQYP